MHTPLALRPASSTQLHGHSSFHNEQRRQQQQRYQQQQLQQLGVNQQQLLQQGRPDVFCEASLFGFLRGGDKGSSSRSRLVEKPLYSKREMFNLGGLEVRPRLAPRGGEGVV